MALVSLPLGWRIRARLPLIQALEHNFAAVIVVLALAAGRQEPKPIEAEQQRRSASVLVVPVRLIRPITCGPTGKSPQTGRLPCTLSRLL